MIPIWILYKVNHLSTGPHYIMYCSITVTKLHSLRTPDLYILLYIHGHKCQTVPNLTRQEFYVPCCQASYMYIFSWNSPGCATSHFKIFSKSIHSKTEKPSRCLIHSHLGCWIPSKWKKGIVLQDYDTCQHVMDILTYAIVKLVWRTMLKKHLNNPLFTMFMCV